MPLLAVFVLVVNDHFLKGAGLLPGVVTGKLSDVAGLFFFPVLLFSVARPFVPSTRALVAVACASTAIVFAAIKTLPEANALANALGPTALDPTDLVALPMCAVAAAYLDDEEETTARDRLRGRELVALVFASWASLATSAVRRPPCTTPIERPEVLAWDESCAKTDGVSVKLGAGRADVELPLHAVQGPCTLRATGLALEWDGDVGTHARVETWLTPEQQKVEQDATVKVGLGLPWTPRCNQLRAVALVPQHRSLGLFSVMPLKIASCAEGGAP